MPQNKMFNLDLDPKINQNMCLDIKYTPEKVDADLSKEMISGKPCLASAAHWHLQSDRSLEFCVV